jgi:hypothetical protein
MRVEIARQTYHPRYGPLEVGAVVEVADDVARHWLARGIATEAAEVIRVGEPPAVRQYPPTGAPGCPEGAIVDRAAAAPLIPQEPGKPGGPGGPRRSRRRIR